ncbi:hypothetical protein [Halobacteriovorax sp.]|uniref:hypothetical protein n=1 Tax=Halobacteriovorax sp. TaxID=2020862 RepID=UPI0035651D4E
MRNFLTLLSILSTFCGNFAQGAEIDSYRNVEFLADGTRFLDQKINSALRNAVAELNENEVVCPVDPVSAEETYDIVKSHISSPFIGHSIAVDIDESIPSNMIVKTEFDFSVYSSITWLEGVSLNLKGLLGVMNLDGRRVGVDKIGHFFVEGFGFFRRAYIKEEGSVESAVRWGKFTENSYFGLTTTGVYSNADLVANYNGMRFWNMLFLFSDDPAFKNKKTRYKLRPYLKCNNSKWKLNKRFGIRMFLDDSWDESLNCNYYDSERIQEAVVHAEAIYLGRNKLIESEGLVCPRVSRSCHYEKNKYGEFAKDILHESCFDKEKQHRVDADEFNTSILPIINGTLLLNDYTDLINNSVYRY